jgi:hypothetical protein
MTKLTTYGMVNGQRFNQKTDELSRLAALGALSRFLGIGKMTACLDPKNLNPAAATSATSLAFWREGPMNEEFAEFEGTAEEIAELAAFFRYNNDADELREALRQRLCCEALPGMLRLYTSENTIGGPTSRAIILMYMAGIDRAEDYMRAGIMHDVDTLVTALELWQEEQAAGRQTTLADILKPAAQAA